MSNAAFGRFYEDGEIIARQGEAADGLYVVQDGTVEIVADDGATEVVLWSAGRHEIREWPSGSGFSGVSCSPSRATSNG